MAPGCDSSHESCGNCSATCDSRQTIFVYFLTLYLRGLLRICGQRMRITTLVCLLVFFLIDSHRGAIIESIQDSSDTTTTSEDQLDDIQAQHFVEFYEQDYESISPPRRIFISEPIRCVGGSCKPSENRTILVHEDEILETFRDIPQHFRATDKGPTLIMTLIVIIVLFTAGILYYTLFARHTPDVSAFNQNPHRIETGDLGRGLDQSRTRVEPPELDEKISTLNQSQRSEGQTI